MDARNWLYLTQNFESPFKHLVGAVAQYPRCLCGNEQMLGARYLRM